MGKASVSVLRAIGAALASGGAAARTWPRAAGSETPQTQGALGPTGGISMQIKTENGIIGISNEVIAAVAGLAASSCFGVKGMTTTSVKDGLVHLLKREAMTTGVKVFESENGVAIRLNIAVDHGLNIPAVCRSIISEVRYNVQRLTGLNVTAVDIFVDSIKA